MELEDVPIALDKAQQIAKEAYIFFQPLVNQYRLKLQYNLPPNRFLVVSYPPGPETKITPYVCADQAYAIAFLDLRKEPVVYSVPVIPDRCYSVMAVDHFAHNFAYIGTRTTGGEEAVDFMIAGPGWKGRGPNPSSGGTVVSAVSETNFVTFIHRIEVFGHDDYENGKQILSSCTLQTLSAYNGSPGPTLPSPDFPQYQSDQQKRAGFFGYANAFTAFAEIYPKEASLYTRFAGIGVYPGAPYPPPAMSPTLLEAVEQGIWMGSRAIESELERPKGVSKYGWSYNVSPPPSGRREDMDGRYLAQAATACSAFEWGNSVNEATYMQTFTDNAGEALNGSRNYTLVWPTDQQPKVNAFWSLTLYDKDGWYTENSLNRYSVASSNTENPLHYDDDGSITIYIQSDPPRRCVPSNNWLPSPRDTPFQLFMRLYLPQDQLLYGSIEDHIPPGATKAE